MVFLFIRYAENTYVMILSRHLPDFFVSYEKYKNKGITVFKIFIWGGKSSDIRSEI